MSTDYIRTARAKGLSRVGLIVRHALGNALIPVLTVIGLGLGNLLGGMVLVETIFNWPGVGQFAYGVGAFRGLSVHHRSGTSDSFELHGDQYGRGYSLWRH